MKPLISTILFLIVALLLASPINSDGWVAGISPYGDGLGFQENRMTPSGHVAPVGIDTTSLILLLCIGLVGLAGVDKNRPRGIPKNEKDIAP